MKVKYSQPRGKRLLKSTHTRPLWIEPIGPNWWFSLESGEWIDHYPSGERCTTSYYSMEIDGFNNIWSLKAAKRKIAKWNVPSGTWFTVSLPWVSHEFKIKKP